MIHDSKTHNANFRPNDLKLSSKKEVVCVIPPATRYNMLITDKKVALLSNCKNATLIYKIIYEAISSNYPKSHVFILGILPLNSLLMNMHTYHSNIKSDNIKSDNIKSDNIKKFEVNYLVISKALINAIKDIRVDIVKFYVGKGDQTYISECPPSIDMISTSQKSYDNEIKYCPFSLRVDLNLI
tara:strand:- start:4730 stop:5281 length:552 start_codon:yes stop_codon:yes gene_type:complete